MLINERDMNYTAFERWHYSPVIIKSNHRQPFRDIIESYFSASANLIRLLCEDKYGQRPEGLAAIFLFRHYLELSLKRIIINGRWLNRQDKNRTGPVEAVGKIHNLRKLWNLVLTDAKPKLTPHDWESYDIPFVEKLIDEFHAEDENGVAFRYAGENGDFCLFDHRTLARVLVHIRQILDGIDTCLVETYADNKAYESYLEAEMSSDY
jgi:hypothetical protein